MSLRDAKCAARKLASGDVSNVTELQKKHYPDLGAQTLQCSLKKYGLICRVWKSRPFLTSANKEKRRLWALAHVHWSVEDWKNVIFSDESKFMLFKSDGCQYAWFRTGQAYDGRYVKKTIKHGGGNIMVWGCITARGVGRLSRIEGKMCAIDYVKILDNDLLGSLTDLKIRRTGNSSAIFQQDNDPKHKSRLAWSWFKTKRLCLLSWPPSSLDMSIIEHVWDQLDCLVRSRDPLPQNQEEMWAALQEEWEKFPQTSLDTLFESMPERVAALVKACGGYTRY